jgi:hypothetical protein
MEHSMIEEIKIETRLENRAETVSASSPGGNSGKTKLVYRGRGGMFQKRPKPPTPAETQRAIASKLTEPLDETGQSHAERILDAQIRIAQRTDIEECGTAPTKAAEFVFKAGGMLAPNPAPVNEKPLQVVVFYPELRDKDGNIRPTLTEADRYVKPDKPNFGDKELKLEPKLLEATFGTDSPIAPGADPKPAKL